MLAGAGLFFWQSASTGYQIVLAPEGVAATSVDYKAFIAPALFWLGMALLTHEAVGRHHRAERQAAASRSLRPCPRPPRAYRIGRPVAAIAAR